MLYLTVGPTTYTDGCLNKMSDNSKRQNVSEGLSKFIELKQEEAKLLDALEEMKGSKEEHELVLESLEDVDRSGTCWLTIGNVQVEMPLQEAQPKVIDSLRTLNSAIEDQHRKISDVHERISNLEA